MNEHTQELIRLSHLYQTDQISFNKVRDYVIQNERHLINPLALEFLVSITSFDMDEIRKHLDFYKLLWNMCDQLTADDFSYLSFLSLLRIELLTLALDAICHEQTKTS